ncbi:14107_t:CDS:2, partial [Racocetra fulgida]
SFNDINFSLTTTNTSSYDSDSSVELISSKKDILSRKDSNFCSKVKAKVTVNISKSDPIPAKWLILELNDFNIFQHNLVKHVQICIDDNNFNNDIKVSYKINRHRQAMALYDEDDYDAFISEYQKLENSDKYIALYIELKNLTEETSNSDEEIPKTKKLKANFIPKVSKLNSDEIELANIISQIRSKY